MGTLIYWSSHHVWPSYGGAGPRPSYHSGRHKCHAYRTLILANIMWTQTLVSSLETFLELLLLKSIFIIKIFTILKHLYRIYKKKQDTASV